MSITKKMLVFIVIFAILPMFFILPISRFVLNKQIEKSEQSYLKNSLKIARNEITNRKDEMERITHLAANSKKFRDILNSTEMKLEIQNIKETFEYLDFIALVNKDKKIIASNPGLKNLNLPELEELFILANQTKGAKSSAKVIPISQLFSQKSQYYEKFKVKITNSDHYLTKCLAGIAVSPIFENLQGNLLGYIIAGDIMNNDDYYPNFYSKSVKGSYLSISIDGIRVTSNIRSPKKQDFIGSSIPISMNTIEGPKDVYFGRVNIDDEIHVFLDEPILDNNGQVIGILGVGIPEERFSGMITINQNIIFIVTITCLLLMLIIGNRLSQHITRPIVKATELAEQIANGKKDVVIENEFLKDKNSETTILLRTFQKMANDLKESEEKVKKYLNELQYQNVQQNKLAAQLKLLNDELEEKVEARTQDLRQAINALKRADEVKSRFLANMSHELRTPLNSTISSSEALKEGIFGPLNDKQQKYINNILTSSSHLLQLINDILDISKIEAGKMTLSLGLYSISDILNDSLNIVKTLAFRKNIDISLKVVPQDFKIYVDAKKLKQILYNILSNAIKFTPDYGIVTVEIYERGEFVHIIIKDTGIGIKEEDQDRIFKEFEQVDGSYDKQYEGTGLGLPLTKKLVELHGGEIHLSSKVGEGTEVIFTLPIDLRKFEDSPNISKAQGNYQIYNAKMGET